jgi:hypothetical protein
MVPSEALSFQTRCEICSSFGHVMCDYVDCRLLPSPPLLTCTQVYDPDNKLRYAAKGTTLN